MKKLLVTALAFSSILAAARNEHISFLRTEDELFKHVGNEDVIVLIYMNGCGHCDRLKPKLNELAKKGYKVVACEQSTCKNLVRQEKIHGFPHTLFFKKGSTQPYDRVSGNNPQAIEKKAQALNK